MIKRIPAPDEHCPYQLDGIYQRKWPGLAGRPSFKVTATPLRQCLADVTHRDVILEGRIGGNARALSRWRIDWVKQHDRWAKLHPTASDEEILTRWRTRHAKRHCWVLTIALLDPIRCMAPQSRILTEVARRGTAQNKGRIVPDGDEYTTATSATIDREAEAVDRATLARLAAEASIGFVPRSDSAKARRRERGRTFRSAQ